MSPSPAAGTDAQLLAAHAAGGPAAGPAIEELVRRHGGTVHCVCLRVLGNESAAQDAAQATLLILARKSGSVRGSLAAWLHRVALNAALAERRAAEERRRREKEAAEMIAKRADDAPAEVLWEDLRPGLDQAIDRLPAAERAAVVMHYLEGRPQTEVAERLGVPEGTVNWRIGKALERLRARLLRGGAMLGGAALGAVLAEHAGGASCPPYLLAAAGKVGAAGATVGATLLGANAGAIAEGAMNMLFWAKVKTASMVLCVAAAVGGGGGAAAVRLAAAAAGEPAKVDGAAEPRPTTTAPEAPRAPAEEWGKEAQGLVARLVPRGRTEGACSYWNKPGCACREDAPACHGRTIPCPVCNQKKTCQHMKTCEECAAGRGACPRCGKPAPSGTRFAPGEAMEFELAVKNVSGKELTLHGGGRGDMWALRFGDWVWRCFGRDGTPMPVPLSLKPGETKAVAIGAGGRGQWHYGGIYRFAWTGEQEQSVGARDVLPEGVWQVKAIYTAPKFKVSSDSGIYLGQIETNSVAITVGPAGEAADGLRLALSVDRTELRLLPGNRNVSPVGTGEVWRPAKLRLTFTNVGREARQLDAYDLVWSRLKLEVTGPDAGSVRVSPRMVEREMLGRRAEDCPVLDVAGTFAHPHEPGFPGDFGPQTYTLLKPGEYRIKVTYSGGEIPKEFAKAGARAWIGKVTSNEIALKVLPAEGAGADQRLTPAPPVGPGYKDPGLKPAPRADPPEVF